MLRFVDATMSFVLPDEMLPNLVTEIQDRNRYYQYTKETYRICSDVLALNPLLKCSVEQWLNNVITDKGLQLDRKHLLSRLETYTGCPSMNGTYIELYPQEVRFITELNEYLQTKSYRIVEVGLNTKCQVCKVAIVVRMPVDIGGRYLFLCIGTMDGGIKTCYVTPFYKQKRVYKCRIPYLTTRDYRNLQRGMRINHLI